MSLSGQPQFETELVHWLPESAYDEGFRRAAEVLSDHVAHFPQDIPDLVMPIMYCYRHAVELRLKRLWTVAGWLERETAPTAKLPAIHDLLKLWETVQPIISSRAPAHRRSRFEVETAEGVIKELAELDPNGVSFRYDKTVKGEPSLSAGVSINLENMWTVMPKLLELLDDTAAGIVVEFLNRSKR